MCVFDAITPRCKWTSVSTVFSNKLQTAPRWHKALGHATGCAYMHYINETNHPRPFLLGATEHVAGMPGLQAEAKLPYQRRAHTTCADGGHNEIAELSNRDCGGTLWKVPSLHPLPRQTHSLTCFLLLLLALRPPPAGDARFDPENFMHLMSGSTFVSQHASSVCKSPD